MLAQSASVSTTTMMNLPIWNITFINFGSLAKVSAILGEH
jgi:hypothetical protein